MNKPDRNNESKSKFSKHSSQNTSIPTKTKKEETFEKQIIAMTTIIHVVFSDGEKEYNSQGSGFYYTQLAPPDPSIKAYQWRKIEHNWLITNRHVAIPKIGDKEYFPIKFTFCFRKMKDGKIDWLPITLTSEELKENLKMLPDSSIDVVAIDIEKVFSNIIKENPKELIISTFLTNDKLPENSLLTIDVTTDIVVASYPKGFYDSFNKFPIVKSGIIASGWNLLFKGNPTFLIDSQLFPGSSGGLVISKPTNIAKIQGKLAINDIKQFVLLGIYSGQYQYSEKEIDINGKETIKKTEYGLGIVWYSSLIPLIIKDGVQYDQSIVALSK